MSEFNGKVIILKVDSKELEVKEIITDSSYDMLKDGVGGFIEALTIGVIDGRMVTIWLNEEGKLIGLEPNFALVQKDEVIDIVMGDIIITSTDEEGETVGLNEKEIEFVKSKFDFQKFGHAYGVVFERILNF